MSQSTLDISDISMIIAAHEGYWDARRGTMNNLTNMMKQQLFRTPGAAVSFQNQIVIEPATAHSVIEGYMSNLYPKAPAVICGSDLKGRGNPDVVQAVINRFLYDQSDILERGMSSALIYPFSFWKLATLPDDVVESVIDQIDMRPVHPSVVIVTGKQIGRAHV